MPGAPPQKLPDTGDGTSSFTGITPVSPVSPNVAQEAAADAQDSDGGSSTGIVECGPIADSNPQIAVNCPPEPNAEVGKTLNVAGSTSHPDDEEAYNLFIPSSCRTSVASFCVATPGDRERSSKHSNDTPGSAPLIDLTEERRNSSSSTTAETGRLSPAAALLDVPVRPSILTNKDGSAEGGIRRRIQEATKVVRLVSVGSARNRGSARSDGLPWGSVSSVSSWRTSNFGTRRSNQSNASSLMSERASLARWAKPVRAFFKQHKEEPWRTYLFGHSLSEAANMRRLGNQSPSDDRLIEIMTAMNELRNKRQEQNSKGTRRGTNNKSRLREEEDAATMLRDSSIHWSYFDIFEKDIGDENMANLPMIRAFSRFATWSRAVAKTISMWSIWYSTCLFFFWDVLADDPDIGSNTAVWHLFQGFDVCLDFLYLFITLSRLVTTLADATSGVEICLPERVAWKVLNQRTFWIDLISCFPWTLNCSAAPSVFPRWLMLLKPLRGWHIFERSHTWLVFQQDLNTIPLLLLIILLFGHVLACVFYFFILDGIPVLDRGKLFPEWNFVQCYMYSYRICVYLLLGEDMEDLSSSGDFYDVNLGRLGYMQDLFVVFCMPVGSLINALVFSQIIVIVQRRSALETIHIEHENQLRQTMISYDLPSSLQLRLLAYYKYEKIHQAHATFGTIFKNLSPQLNFELRLFLYYEQVTGVPLFESCQPRVLRELVLRLNDRLFLPGDYICRFGDKGEEMYFICKGSCSVIAEDMTHVLAELGLGGHFGEIAVIMGQKRTAYVRANGFCLTASLSKDNFEEIMREYPEELRVILSKMSSEKKQQIQDIGRNSISAGQHGLKLNISKLQEAAEKSRRDSNAETADEDDEESEESSSSSAEENDPEADDEAPSELPTLSTLPERKDSAEDSAPTSVASTPLPDKAAQMRRPSVLKRNDAERVSLKPRNRSVSILHAAEVHHHRSDDEGFSDDNVSTDGKRRVSFATFDTQHLMHDINETESNPKDSDSEDEPPDKPKDKPPALPISLPKADSTAAGKALPKVETKVDKSPTAPIEKEAKNTFGNASRWSRIQNAFNFGRKMSIVKDPAADAKSSSAESKSSLSESKAASAQLEEVQEDSVKQAPSEEPLVVDEVTEATAASSSVAPLEDAQESTPASSSTAPPPPEPSSAAPALLTSASPAASSSPATGSTPREAWASSGTGVSGFGTLGGTGSNLWASPRQGPRPVGGGRRISVANHSSTADSTSPRPGGLRRISLAEFNSSASSILAERPSGPLAAVAGLGSCNRQPMLSTSARGSLLDDVQESEASASGAAVERRASGSAERRASGSRRLSGTLAERRASGSAAASSSTGTTAASSSEAPAGASTMDGEVTPQKVSALLDAGGFGDGMMAGEAPSDSASASDETHREKKRRSTLTVPHAGSSGTHRLGPGTSSKRNSPTSSGTLMPIRPPNRSAFLNSQHSTPPGTNSSPSDSQTTGSLCLSSGVQSATLASGTDSGGVAGAQDTLSAAMMPQIGAVTSHQELAEKLDREVAQGKREAASNLGAQLKTLNKAVDELVDVQLKVGRCIKSMEQDSEDLEKALHEVRSLWQAKAKALQRDDHLFQEVLDGIKLHVEAAHEGVELLLEDVRGELDNHEIDLAAQAMNIVNSQNDQDSRPHTPILPPEPEPRRRKSSVGGSRIAEAMNALADGKDSRREMTESKSDSQAEREREHRRRPSKRESRPGTPGQDDDRDRRGSMSAHGRQRRSLVSEAAANRSNVINMVL